MARNVSLNEKVEPLFHGSRFNDLTNHMVRLKDIAQQVGVSIMTVSKALRDAPDVSAATKTNIQKIARQMGYVPDSSAQGLRTKTTKLFGLLIPATTNPVYARMVMALRNARTIWAMMFCSRTR